jgi:hypothetical protein
MLVAYLLPAKKPLLYQPYDYKKYHIFRAKLIAT